MIIRYDKTLTGFCCLLGSAIKNNLQWSSITSIHDQYSADLFHDDYLISTDPEWAERVTKGLKERLGADFVRKIGLAFLSEQPNIETDLILVTRSALKYGNDFLKQINHPRVHPLENAALKTGRDRHRLLGLIRFSKLTDNSYFACIEPQTNVVPLLGNHFSSRFADQDWVIHDTVRCSGLVGTKGSWNFVPDFKISHKPQCHQSEPDVAHLWRSFYRHISNPQRFNPGLRNQFMPKQYWRYLTEMQSEEIAAETFYPPPKC